MPLPLQEGQSVMVNVPSSIVQAAYNIPKIYFDVVYNGLVTSNAYNAENNSLVLGGIFVPVDFIVGFFGFPLLLLFFGIVGLVVFALVLLFRCCSHHIACCKVNHTKLSLNDNLIAFFFFVSLVLVFNNLQIYGFVNIDEGRSSIESGLQNADSYFTNVTSLASEIQVIGTNLNALANSAAVECPSSATTDTIFTSIKTIANFLEQSSAEVYAVSYPISKALPTYFGSIFSSTQLALYIIYGIVMFSWLLLMIAALARSKCTMQFGICKLAFILPHSNA